MTVLHKKAHVPNLKSVLFSDPSYAPGTWCRYEANLEGNEWLASYQAIDQNDEGYEYVDFALVLARPDIMEHINIKPNLASFSYPKKLTVVEHEVGMDTACVYLGPHMVFDPDDWQPSCALRTGTDGLFGEVYELQLTNGAGEQSIVGIILLGSIDAMFETKESLWAYLQSSFNMQAVN